MRKAHSLIEEYLAAGNLKEAIKTYIHFCNYYHDNDRKASAILQSARANDLFRRKLKRLITEENYEIEIAQINYAMIEAAEEMPDNWTDESIPETLIVTPVSTPSPTSTKLFLEKWGITLGIVVGLSGVFSIALKDFIFPSQQDTVIIPAKPDTLLKPEGAVNPEKSRVHSPKTSPTTGTVGRIFKKDTNLTTFISSGRIVDNMEIGKVNGELAYRNIRTKKILCCYEDADDFSEGKAWVKQKGTYFYIDQEGSEIKK